MNITLIGDSVFDNSAYIPGEKDTIQRLRDLLPSHNCQLRAADGSVTREVIELQIPFVDDADVIFVSSGGNDALQYSSIIYSGFGPESIDFLYHAKEEFQEVYEEMILELKSLKKPFAVFTIYSGCFPQVEVQKAADVAISIFNDVIYQVCNKHKVKVLEMRDIIYNKDHYANEIEPSSLGSKRLAEAIVKVLKKK